MSVKVLVTGAAGQIAYSLTYMICRGQMFGKDTKVTLHLLDLPQMMTSLQGLVMELEDCCFPLLEKVICTSDLKEAFHSIDVACMVGAMPRRQGMERKDLLEANVKIFKEQGIALNSYAKKTAKVVVVGNPANTNCFIMSHYAPGIPKNNFSALTRLDHNRAIGQLAKACDVSCDKIKNAIIWGNHSSTQFVDVSKATVCTHTGVKHAKQMINNDDWLRGDFLKMIQTRGGSVIAARKLSSAMSAARAIVDHVHDWWCGTPEGEHVSMAVYSNGYYGSPKNLFFSFPVTIKDREWKIVEGIEQDDWAKEMMAKTGNELVEERDLAIEFTKC